MPDTVGYDTGGTYGGFDRFGRVIDQKWQNTAGTVKDRYSYTYDRNSNRLARTNGVSSNHSEAYTYDGLNRLTSRGLSSWRAEWWTLDALGNWGAYNTQGVTPTLHQTREHNAANEIADTTGNQEAINQTEGPAWAEPAYDHAGNMTAGPIPGNETTSHSYTYDAWNRLVKVQTDDATPVTVAEYRYDGLNRRIVKLVRQSGSTGSGIWDRTDYYYNQAWQCLDEYAATSQSSTDKELVAATHQAWYVWDPRYIDAPVLRGYNTDLAGGLDQMLFYCQDANFNTTGLVDPVSGNVVERYFYDAYGSVTVCDGSYNAVSWANSQKNEILYCGYRYDPETGLYQVRNRYYHLGLGVFMERDSGATSVMSIDEGEPAVDGGVVPHDSMGQYADGMNLYTYARSSPLMYVDPEGLSTQCGQMGMTCKSGNKQWPVYGNSARAKAILGGKEGCVTLLVPKAIFCTGSCSDIKDWNSAGDPSVKILEHEACHACAHEDPCDSYFLSWIPGDLTGHCDRNKKTVTPGW